METFTNVELYVPALRKALGRGGPMGIGLRLSDRAARELLEGRHLERFKRWLDRHDLYVFTLNGFPFGGFHRAVVKDDVYRPDWTTAERSAYTLRLIDVLAAILPADMDGGISTSPISYKPWHPPDKRADVFRQGAERLAEVVVHLADVRDRRGRLIHIDLEPEPDCLIENAQETVEFFEHSLVPFGGRVLMDRLGVSSAVAERMLLDHIRICYDACHFAVAYEAPSYALDRFADAGLKVGKVQISSALSVPFSQVGVLSDRSRSSLSAFAESTYLHQVVERRVDGSLQHFADLSEAIEAGPGADAVEWRVHFHVPLFTDGYGDVNSTREDLERCLRLVREHSLCPHLEIETYTWEVLPPELKVRLSASIAREYEWVLSVMETVPGAVERMDEAL